MIYFTFHNSHSNSQKDDTQTHTYTHTCPAPRDMSTTLGAAESSNENTKSSIEPAAPLSAPAVELEDDEEENRATSAAGSSERFESSEAPASGTIFFLTA